MCSSVVGSLAMVACERQGPPLDLGGPRRSEHGIGRRLGVAVGAVALATATLAAWPDRRPRPLGALVGALSVQVLLRLDIDATGMFGAPHRASPPRPSSSRPTPGAGGASALRIRTIALVAGGALVVATAAVAVAVALVQEQVNQAA